LLIANDKLKSELRMLKEIKFSTVLLIWIPEDKQRKTR